MEGAKSTRRKRRDHESRDYTCRCGKSYLSYAAAYTHVKNKHDLQKEFLDDIGKPEREKLPRGRPKEKKEPQSTLEHEQLSVLEEAILKIYQLLHDKFDRLVLEGNTKKSAADVDAAFLVLADKKLPPNLRPNEKAEEFAGQLSKHFSVEVSARIKVAGTVVARAAGEGEGNAEAGRQIAGQLECYDLWKGENEVNSIIYEAFLRWARLAH